MQLRSAVRIHPLLRLPAFLAVAVFVFADCLPIANGPITINGIVVGRGIVGGGGACPGSAGWDGVPAGTFAPVNGIPDTHKGSLFVTASASGGNLSHMFVGLHVENAEQFTSGDMLTLYVDTNNNGAFDGKDFVLHFEIGPNTPPTNEDCKGTPHNVTMYTTNGASWVNPVQNPPGITAMTSWDYDNSAPDPEYQIWELEIDINLSTLGITIPAAGSKVGIGARLYLNEPAMGGTTLVFAYPSTVTTDANPNDIDPNTGNVTAANLAKYDVGTCGFDVRIDTVSSIDTKGNTNQFTRFPGAISGTLSGTQTNTFTASVTFYDPGGSSGTVAAPNAGNINFTLIPYGNGNPLDHIAIGSVPAAFDHLNQVILVNGNTVQWPHTEADYAPHRATFADGSADHTCIKVDLAGYIVNTIAANDSAQQNLAFTHFSTIQDQFHIRAPREAKPSEDPDDHTIEFVLRPRWENVPKGAMSPDPRTQPPHKFSFKFLNAGGIGLKYAGKGYWLVRLRPGEDKVVKIALSGGPMPFKTMKVHVPPNAGGTVLTPASGVDPIVVPVQEGMLVTLIANGLMWVDAKHTENRQNNPEGFADREEFERHFLLNPRGAYLPWQNIGTLVGSFDKFRTAFRIGGSASIIVPKGVKQLFLAINDVAGQYGDNGGQGFDVNIVLSPATTLPTRLASFGNPMGLPDRLDLGAAMPQLNIDIMQLNRKWKSMRPGGYVSWAVFDSHP